MQFRSSWIEISRSALAENVGFLKGQIGLEVRFSSVIKGNAYGHGIRVFVPLAEQCGIRHFSVFSAHEAFEALESRTENTEVMVMGVLEPDELEWAVERGVSFYVFDLERLVEARKAAERVGRRARIHLELETGLHRTGLQDGEVEEAADLILAHRDRFSVEGVCTHYAGAESVGNFLRIQQQIRCFHEQCEVLRARGLAFPLRHTASSAAALTYPETVMDMVRFGIAQYGFWPSKETQMSYLLRLDPLANQRTAPSPLKRVISWKSRIMNIQTVKPGEWVGYGTSYQTTRLQKIAAVPVGYFHGFARSLSNLGHVLVHGRRALVVGVVEMNMMLIDVTDLPNVKKGDEVVMIGSQRKAQITVASFSDLSRFLNYEVLVSLADQIPRVVVD